MTQSPSLSPDAADAPDWWADLQQDRAQMTGADNWLGEDIDFTPRPAARRGGSRFERGSAPRRAGHEVRRPRTESEARVLDALAGIGDEVEEVGVTPVRTTPGSFEVVLGDDGRLTSTEIATFNAADPVVIPDAPPAPARATVRITGRPDRHTTDRADRGLLDLIGPHPDRIAFWVVLLGALLVLLSVLSAHA